MTALDIVTIIADIIAITLGIMAIILSRNSEKRSKTNLNEILKINKLINKKLNIVDDEILDMDDDLEDIAELLKKK